ncbi:polysaccharide deacetylase family protein [Pseudomonas sp. LS1212]|uniref:polysaccharide deacetylase family protein n=1 Tax=Pseudomonas sp. LS1212 TaxID=2972478 RepID=UPI00215D2B9E|nr:polysaccharide deacetylase family protein [Pseudomonas sp. LS1212]UVJ43169.1 polysaccharide deacetylase family protein [Pseudomonas sp. LS1212]
MLEDTCAPRSLLLVLHDVAPQTWADYHPFVEAVDALGSIPMTLLVVPDFHKCNAVDRDGCFRHMLDRRLAQGDELALHGYYHVDDSPAPRTARDFFMRRVYTREGEFYALDQQQALNRLLAGIEVFHRHDWPLEGFVAPAWLMSEGTRQALRSLPLHYTSDPQHLYRLPDFSCFEAPGLVWSTRSAWRRGVSRLLNERYATRLQHAPTIRLGLHPVDMRHGFSRNYWFKTLQQLLHDGREPMTKAAWLASQDRSGGPGA